MPRKKRKAKKGCCLGICQTSLCRRLKKVFKNRKGVLGEILSEFLGVFFFTLIANGTLAQHVISEGTYANSLTVHFGYGIGKMIGLYITGRAIKAHLNPAISVANGIFRRMALGKVAAFIIAQFAGAFCASFIIYSAYTEALNEYDGGERITFPAVDTEKPSALIFAQNSDKEAFQINTISGWIDQVVGTSILSAVSFAITDINQKTPPSYSMVVTINGILIFALSLSFSFNVGFALNPARDVGPRIFIYLYGWKDLFKGYWFLIPIAGPIVGAVAGAFLYTAFIGFHLPKSRDSKKLKFLRMSAHTAANDTGLRRKSLKNTSSQQQMVILRSN